MWKQSWTVVVVLGVLSAGPAGAQGVLAQSTFDVDDEGWLVGGPIPDPPGYFATGGNPGGFIRGFDASGPTGGRAFWAFIAPAGYLGDVSAAYGGALSFDLRQDIEDGTPFNDDDVTLIGGGFTIVIDAGPNPATTWTSYSVPIVESAGWVHYGTSQPPTMTEMQAVLGSLSELWIRGEFIAGNDSADLDNVVLTSTGVPAMSEAALLLLVGLLVLVSFAALGRLGT